MTWVRLEDGFTEHPKIAALSSDALALFVAALCYSNRNLTDGFVPTNVGYGQLRDVDNATPPILELERAGLWEPADRGWQIHDFADYQPTRAGVLAERKATADRVRRFRARSNTVTNGVSNTTPVPEPVPVTSSGVGVRSSSSNSNRGRGSKGEGRARSRLEAANVPPEIAGNVRSVVEREIP